MGKIIAILLLLFIILILVFSIPAVQTKLGKYATKRLNEDFKTNINIDKIGLQYNGDVNIKGVLIRDYKKDTLIAASKINTSILSVKNVINGTLNFGDGSVITVNTPNDLRKAAKKLQEIKVKPEIEAFDLGNMWFGSQLYKEGLLDDPPMFQMCLGIPWGAPATPLAMQAMKDIMPKEGIWSGFAISKNEMPYVAQTVVMGGNPRVGLEDNLYLSKGKLATNPQLVEKAIRIVTDLGVEIMSPSETREKLKLVKHK